MDNSPRGNLIDNRFVVRKGHFTINGDNVSLSMRMSDRYINCHHVIGHLDNQCADAIILQKFDQAVGGIAARRSWDYLKFPVWHLSELPPQLGKKKKGRVHGDSSVMIARTDADCHGNVVDGDQVQSDLDVSPRAAADYRGPLSYQLTQALSDLDELFGRETRFFERYHEACIAIEADKHVSDDFFFTAQTDAARDLLLSTKRNADLRFPYIPGARLVRFSELSPRRFKKLTFTASVFVLETLRQRPLTLFSKLRRELSKMFALSTDFACGLLCRMLPQSSVIGLNKCAFAHAKSIDAEGRVVLDVELTLRAVFLGEDRVFGKALDNKTIVVRGSELDDVCVVLERKETLHVVEVRQKSPTDSVDNAFKPVQDAGQLIVGSEDETTLLRHMSLLSNDKLQEAVSLTSSVQRAIRILFSRSSPVEHSSKSGVFETLFCRSVIFPDGNGHMAGPGDRPHVLRTAMAAGMLEASDEAKVEKVVRSIHSITWARVIRNVISDVYMRKRRRHEYGSDSDVNRDYNSDILVRVSSGSDAQESEPHSDAVLFSSGDNVKVAALIKGGFALGMTIERPVGTAVAEGNGRDRMILTVGDDIMRLALESKFGS